ncbi:MAG: superoxide dismutase [Sphingomonas bacterium]|nr:superoxide dismutase family protein [Sphingomonas bacterium]MDB5688167.1 superoxide dismutase [Sphingomonas bacterium]
MNRLARIATLAATAIAVPALAAGPITAPLAGANNAQLGTVQVTEAPGGVLLRVEATGLTPGWHAIHFHEKGTCADAGFKAAGAHVHAGKAPPVHGLLNPARKDNGDLPNFFVAADGTAKAEMFSTLVSMKGGAGRLALTDADGSAVVVHANADDYRTQPIGGAGDRIGCAVIK